MKELSLRTRLFRPPDLIFVAALLLDAVALRTTQAIRLRRPCKDTAVQAPADMRSQIGWVPRWFIHLLTTPEIGAAFPVAIDVATFGEIVPGPDLSADGLKK